MIDENYSEFYYHDVDMDGCPFVRVENPVNTIFGLKGSEEAVAAACTIVAREWIRIAKKDDSIEMVRHYYALGCYIIHLRTNNYIPQLYDAIKEVDGLTSAKYAIYDVAHDRLITNDLYMAKAIKHGENLEHEIELDDETTPFPMDCELSLPTEFC